MTNVEKQPHISEWQLREQTFEIKKAKTDINTRWEGNGYIEAVVMFGAVLVSLSTDGEFVQQKCYYS